LLETVVDEIVPGSNLQADISVFHRLVIFAAPTPDSEQFCCLDQRHKSESAPGIAEVLLCPLLRTVGFGSSESLYLAAAKLGIQEPLIELHVVTDDRQVTDEAAELLGDVCEAFSLCYVAVLDPMDSRRGGRDWATWVEQAGEAIGCRLTGARHLREVDLDCSDGDDTIKVRIKTGRFDVQYDRS
jgi:hypothetical protein